jgi:serine/threonine-protein kinase
VSELEPGTEFAGHRIEGVAGQGGMGVVYQATHLALDITVALKVIKPELARDDSFRERFKRESRSAASIEHPNVLPVRHAGEEEGLLYITMRYVEGTDLRSLIDTRGRLPAERAVAIICSIAAALDAAHAAGLVHRDVKPANILLEGADGSGHAYLTDFGLTRHTKSDAGLTKTGQWVGTLDYVAPEQIEGRPTDARSDVYALGCVLYESLTGTVPFAKESEVATMYAHLNEDAPPPRESVPDLPPAIDDVIERALAKNPDDRYPSAGDFAAAAAAAVRGTEVAQPEKSVAVGDAAPSTAGAAAMPAAETAAGRPAPGETAASRPSPVPETTAGAASPTRAGGKPPPPPPAPKAPRKGGGGSRRPLLVAGGVIAVLAVVVGALFAAGVIGGDDGPSAEERAAEEAAAEQAAEEEAAAQESAAEGTVDEFREAFGSEGISTIENLLAPDAPYRYLGFEEKPAVDEYRDLFAAVDPKDYQLTVDSLTFEEGSSPAAVIANLTYEYATENDNRSSGALEWRMERDGTDGDYKIDEISARPDLYSYFTITDPPTKYSVDLFAGRTEQIGQTEGTLQAEGDGVPIRIPIDEEAAPELDGTESLRSIATFRESAGKSTDTTKLEYPYAS